MDNEPLPSSHGVFVAFVFEMGSHCVVQNDLEAAAILLQASTTVPGPITIVIIYVVKNFVYRAGYVAQQPQCLFVKC